MAPTSSPTARRLVTRPDHTLPPRDSLWARMVERWRAKPESLDDYDARQW